MLTTILNLFAKSPFAPLTSHMARVSECVHQLPLLFDCIDDKNLQGQLDVVAIISELEHFADMTKNEIRNQLPKGLFMPIDKAQLLELLSLQDSIADTVQDAAVLTTLKPLTLDVRFKKPFLEFLQINIGTFDETHLIIKDLHQLLESSFGGVEAEKVRSLVHNVARKEHETDIIQHQLLRSLFDHEQEMTFGQFFLWEKIFHHVGAISNLSEKLANRVRMMLELR